MPIKPIRTWQGRHNTGKHARIKAVKDTVATGGKADGPVRLRLDARTVITVSSERMIAFWRARYPDLQVI